MLFTKVSGVLLATLLVILGLKEVAHVVYHGHELEEPAYVIEVPEEAAGAVAEVEGPVDYGTLIAAADLAAGEAASRKCLACHTFDAGGPTITGPNLHDVLGRTAGAVAGFNYSDAMKSFGQQWSYDNMYHFLENPRGYINGTAMVFAGLPNEEERIALIAWLRSINPASPPLPAPLAAVVPAAAPAGDAVAPADAAATAGTAAAGDAVPTEGAQDAVQDAAEQDAAGENAAGQATGEAPAQ